MIPEELICLPSNTNAIGLTASLLGNRSVVLSSTKRLFRQGFVKGSDGAIILIALHCKCSGYIPDLRETCFLLRLRKCEGNDTFGGARHDRRPLGLSSRTAR
uniref:Uncharacterized protein n=1 Tax=Chelativorans sp. (strain BNC1) TaxID=266779 RepID=Q11E14_CHESB